MRLDTFRILKVTLSSATSILLMIIIFMLSSQNSGESSSLSESIARYIAEIFISGYDQLNSVDQQNVLDSLSFPIRKAAHSTEYAALGISLFISCWQILRLIKEIRTRNLENQELIYKDNDSRKLNTKMLCYTSLSAFLISVSYACSDEIHQLFIDGRSGQLSDVLVDSFGALIGVLICSLIMKLIFRDKKDFVAK